MPQTTPARSFSSLRHSLSRQVRRHRRPLAGLLVAWAAVLILGELRPAPAPVRRVAAAGHDLPAGSIMAASDLTTLALPEQSLPPEVVTESSQLVGRLLAIATPAGTPLTTSMVVSGTSLMLGGRIAGRQSVAMPVRLTDAGAATLLVTGDLVDVWATRTAAEGAPLNSAEAAVAVRVASGARVLAVPHPRSSGSLSGSDTSAGGLVVLAVPTTVVPELAYASAAARLTVTVLTSP